MAPAAENGCAQMDTGMLAFVRDKAPHSVQSWCYFQPLQPGSPCDSSVCAVQRRNTRYSNQPGRNNITSPSSNITLPLSNFSQRPVFSVSFLLPSAITASVTISASSAM